jgi:hypothetical protein
MVLFLVLNVSHDRIRLGLAYRESSVPALPTEYGASLRFQPFRGRRLQMLHEVRDRFCLCHATQDMNVVCNTTNDEGRTLSVIQYTR